jgi:hypothetical protein
MSLSIQEVIRARQLAIEICNVLPKEDVIRSYALYASLPDDYSQFVARGIASIFSDFIDIPEMYEELGLRD